MLLGNLDDERFRRARKCVAVQLTDGLFRFLFPVESYEGRAANVPRSIVAKNLQVDDLAELGEDLAEAGLVGVQGRKICDVL